MKTDNKTIEQVENDYWQQPPANSSNLVKSCFAIRRKKIKHISISEMRLLINQDISLGILIPRAIEELEKDIFVEADYYEGDLLKSVLTSDKKYWLENTDQKKKVEELFIQNKTKLELLNLPDDAEEELRDAFEQFVS